MLCQTISFRLCMAAAAAAAATVSAALEEEMGVYYIQEKNRNSLSKEKNYNNRSISFWVQRTFLWRRRRRCLLLLCSPFIHNFVSWKIKWYNYSLAQKTGFNANMHSCALIQRCRQLLHCFFSPPVAQKQDASRYLMTDCAKLLFCSSHNEMCLASSMFCKV